MTILPTQLAHLRRLGWLVVVFAVLAVGAQFLLTQGAATTYLSRSALTTASPKRAPEQDAYLAQGYAEHFNQPAYQALVRDRQKLPPSVTFLARTAATSPIIYVEVTAADPATAAAASVVLAGALRDDVNAGLQADIRRRIEAVNALIAAEQRRYDNGASGIERALIPQEIQALQTRVADILGDTTNQIKDLQLDAGASEIGPKRFGGLATALVAGALAGLVLALALGTWQGRLVTPADVRNALRLPVLAAIPGGRGTTGRRLRLRRLRELAAVLDRTGDPRPLTIAVTSPHRTEVVSELLDGWMRSRAGQDERSMVMHLEVRHSLHDEPFGMAHALEGDGHDVVSLAAPGPIVGLRTIPAGCSPTPTFELVTPARLRSAVAAAAEVADYLVLDAGPLAVGAEALLTCAIADHVVVLLEQEVTTASAARDAITLLEQAGANVMGVVIAGRRPFDRDDRTKPSGSVPEALDREPVGSSAGTINA